MSGDRSAEEAASYHAHMPFPMAAFSPSAFTALMRLFCLRGVPSLVVLRVADGQVVSKGAREGVMRDPQGFPWAAAPGTADQTAGGLAQWVRPALILLLTLYLVGKMWPHLLGF